MEKLNHSSRRGQTLVEFALILLVLLTLAVFIFDLGRAVYYYSAIQNAAREGVRYGAVNPVVGPTTVTEDAPGMKAAAVNYAIGLGLELSEVQAGMGTPELVGGYANPTVKVSIAYTFTPATPLLANFLSGGVITLRGQSVMRTEWLPR